VLACFTCQVASATEPRRVLILRYSVGYSDLLARNVRAELEQQSLGDLQIYDALFTTARVADESAIARYGDYLATLFPEQRLDLAVTIGSPAVYFFQRYGRQFFPSTHMLAAAQESRLPSNLGQLETAAAVSLDLVGGVENILKVLPETTNVSVVIGNSPLEQYWLTKARIAFQPFAGRLSFRWLNDFSFDDILKHAATLPPQSAVLYINLLSDALGAGYSDHEVVLKLRAIAKAPIFIFDDADFGQGIIGGPMLSTQGISRDAASIALRILRGEALGGVTITGIGVGATPKYDWREMQRWGISESRLPPGSQIYFRDPTAWQQYSSQILAISGGIVLQAMFIAWLLYERRYRYRAEAAARDAASELVRMNRLAAAGELTASIAHEINQPLTGIVLNASAVRRLLSKEKPAIDKVLGMIDQIEKAGHHASDVIQNIRATFRRDTHNKSSVDVNRIIVAVLALGKKEIQKHEIKVKIELDDQLPTVCGNEVQLQQVVLNLVMNAIDAMASVQARILRIQSHLSKDGMVHVSIEDTGTGIDPADVSRIFKPLFSTKATGMGMGLSICHSIIESHRGQIWVEAGADRGSLFQFELPVG
jgi:signal transduction histidine kinase